MATRPVSSGLERIAAGVLRANAELCKPDEVLLQQFVEQRDEAAFAELVRRHARFVGGVCRQVTRDAHAAEDAVQATFLHLARKAPKLLKRPLALPGWLYRVSRRFAVRAHRATERRKARDRAAPAPSGSQDPVAEITLREVVRAVDDEIAALPGKYKDPVVLCYLGGLTQDQAASHLGMSRSTLQFRLARGRELLEQRLGARGISVSVALTAALLTPGLAPSADAVRTLSRAAVQCAAGHTPIGVSAGVLALSRGGSASFANAWGAVGGLILAAGLLGTSWLMAGHTRDRATGDVASGPAETPAVSDLRPGGDAAPAEGAADRVTGRVTGPDGSALAGAEVAALTHGPTGPRQATVHDVVLTRCRTDDGGRFTVDFPVDATASLSRSRPRRLLVSAPGLSLTTVAAMPGFSKGFEVRVPGPREARLRLLDPTGRPAVGIRVTPVQVGEVRAEAADRPPPPCWPAAVFSDLDGLVVFRGVDPAGGFRVWVQDDRYAHQAVGPDEFAAVSGEVTVRLNPPRRLEVKVRAADTTVPLGKTRLVMTALRPGTDEEVPGIVFIGDTGADGVALLPPFAADRYQLAVYPPDEAPYLPVTVRRDWPVSKPDRHSETVSLPLGVLVRGRVDGPDGRPVHGARVQIAPTGTLGGAEWVTTGVEGSVRSGADGRFALAAPHGRSTILVHGPSDRFVSRAVADDEPGAAGRPRAYAHAAAALDLPSGCRPPEQLFRLSVGVTLRARVETADGRPADGATLVCRSKDLVGAGGVLEHIPSANGHVELPGCDPERDYHVLLFDARAGQSGIGVLSHRRADPVPVVRLHPCGTAAVQFVAPDGTKRWTNSARLAVSLPPDSLPGRADRVESDRAEDDEVDALWVDPTNYNRQLLPDEFGRLVLPALIPGVRYRLCWHQNGRWHRSDGFTVKPGEALRLPDFVLRP